MKRTLSTLFVSVPLVAAAAGAVDRVQLTQLASGLVNPTGVVNAGDGSGRLFVLLQRGLVLIWDGTKVLPTPFLDIDDRVLCCGERGLLGLAFHPDYANNGELFVDYTDLSGDTVVARFRVSDADPDVADPASEEILLMVDQPFPNHNGGQLNFGPDGFLYISMGDGGASGGPENPAQDLSQLLGKLLRIDVDGGVPYGIPADNPFVDDPTALDEIWAYGLRNPWRHTFDRATGDLFIGDVGASSIEEVDFQPASSPGGENYGWPLMEGSECFNPPTDCNDGTLTLPILEYPHFGGGFKCSVTAGYRYRGSAHPEIDGLLIYGDYCSGEVWAGAQLQGNLWVAIPAVDSGAAITSFGEDELGELYMVEQGGGFFRVEGIAAPLCEVTMSAGSYGVGDTVTIDSLRVANPTGSDVDATAIVGVVVPGGSDFKIVLNTSVTLAAGFDQTLGPIALGEVTGSFPLGTYTTVCELLESGDPIAVGTADFDVQ